MDPDYVYNLYKLALLFEDSAEAETHLSSLREWMTKGGYAPLGWK